MGKCSANVIMRADSDAYRKNTSITTSMACVSVQSSHSCGVLLNAKR
jgi:hypothetical protein